MEFEVREYRRGTWRYDGTIPVRVRLIAMNGDLFHEADHAEPPLLSADGWAFPGQFAYLPSDARAACRPSSLDETYGAFAPAAQPLRLDEFAMPHSFGESEAAPMATIAREFPGIEWDDVGS